MNYAVLVGRLTKDIELRYTTNNVSTCQFTVAVNRNFKNEKGEYVADFIECVAWNKLAENLSKYCHKGDLIAVKGHIQTRSYKDKNGNNRYVTEVMTEQITYLNTKKEDKVETSDVDAYEQFSQENELDVPW